MAALFSHSQETIQPAQPWDGSAIPSQDGKTVIVTGANSGIGFYTARKLAACGAHVILACRSEVRGRQAEQEMTNYLVTLKPPSKGSIEFMQLELGSLASVRTFVEALHGRGFQKLDVLVNNAGLSCPAEMMTPDGFETQFQVNHLGHFYLTTLLFPLLKNAEDARVVNVSSLAHRIVRSMEFPTLATGTDNAFTRYGRSKLANLLFTFELAKRLDDAEIRNVKVVAAHPGLTYSDMGAKWVEGVFPQWLWGFGKWVLTVSPTQETEMGALPLLYSATARDATNGDYFGPANLWNTKGFPVNEVPHANSQCQDDRRALWGLSEQLTGSNFVL